MTRAVLFKMDASSLIGNGHLVRCLVLAEGLRQRGFRVEFLSRELPGHRCDWIEQKGFRVWRLPASPSSLDFNPADCTTWAGVAPDEDVTQTLDLLRGQQFSWLVIDHYALAEPQHRALAELARRVLVIDDLANRKYYCDLLLDATLNRHASAYAGRIPENCRLLLGTDYALLRSEFAALRKAAQQRRSNCLVPRKLLIACGATDPENISLQLLHALDGSEWTKALEVTVVLASNAVYVSEVRRFCESRTWIRLLENVKDMAQLMVEQDLAVGAAGSGVWERACLGLPSLVVVTGIDQADIIRALDACSACLRATPPGMGRSEIDPTFFLIQLHKLCTSPDIYSDLTQKSFALCDGLGVGRVVDAIVAVSGEEVLS
jgi:UDP-2,4-diacetamido-2,4,6-trideoxy-beta-L-altropyranose hydrolase